MRFLEKDNGEWLQIPDYCLFCKQETDVHWQQHYEGPDVTQFGGDFIGDGKGWEDLTQQNRKSPSWPRMKKKIGGKDAES
jgi:hypothetical protein